MIGKYPTVNDAVNAIDKRVNLVINDSGKRFIEGTAGELRKEAQNPCLDHAAIYIGIMPGRDNTLLIMCR